MSDTTSVPEFPDDRMLRDSAASPLTPFGPTILWWAFLPYAVLSICHVWALAADNELAGPTKVWLMPLLAVPVLVGPRAKHAPLAFGLLIAALTFSWLGDAAGSFFPATLELPFMLLCFGIAHVAYLILFTKRLKVRRLPLWTIVYAAWWVAMMIVVGPHTGPLLSAVAAYGLVLGGTATFAARCPPLVAVGGAFFLASDTILAFRLFLPAAVPDWTSPAVMATYTLGQGLIVAGSLLALRHPMVPNEPPPPETEAAAPPQSTAKDLTRPQKGPP